MTQGLIVGRPTSQSGTFGDATASPLPRKPVERRPKGIGFDVAGFKPSAK